MVRYFLFDHIPGAWTGWVLAVQAISVRDAQRRVKYCWHGGHYIGEGRLGSIKAHCGDITDRAQEAISANYRRWLNANT